MGYRAPTQQEREEIDRRAEQVEALYRGWLTRNGYPHTNPRWLAFRAGWQAATRPDATTPTPGEAK